MVSGICHGSPPWVPFSRSSVGVHWLPHAPWPLLPRGRSTFRFPGWTGALLWRWHPDCESSGSQLRFTEELGNGWHSSSSGHRCLSRHDIWDPPICGIHCCSILSDPATLHTPGLAGVYRARRSRPGLLWWMWLQTVYMFSKSTLNSGDFCWEFYRWLQRRTAREVLGILQELNLTHLRIHRHCFVWARQELEDW